MATRRFLIRCTMRELRTLGGQISTWPAMFAASYSANSGMPGTPSR